MLIKRISPDISGKKIISDNNVIGRILLILNTAIVYLRRDLSAIGPLPPVMAGGTGPPESKMIILRPGDDFILHHVGQGDEIGAVAGHAHDDILVLLRRFLRGQEGFPLDDGHLSWGQTVVRADGTLVPHMPGIGM